VLAFVYYYQGRKELIPEEFRKEEAQALLAKVLEADPAFAPARANFGEDLRQMGDVQGSIRELIKVRDLLPSNPGFLQILNLIRARRQQGTTPAR